MSGPRRGAGLTGKTRSRDADGWSSTRCAAFLAAIFAIVLSALLPFGAMASVAPGGSLVLCTTEGPRTIASDAGSDAPDETGQPAKCAYCLLVAATTAPPPPPVSLPEPIAPRADWKPGLADRPPEARGPPPRPPSTAPPRP